MADADAAQKNFLERGVDTGGGFAYFVRLFVELDRCCSGPETEDSDGSVCRNRDRWQAVPGSKR